MTAVAADGLPVVAAVRALRQRAGSPSKTPPNTAPTRRTYPGVEPMTCMRELRRITNSGRVSALASASGKYSLIGSGIDLIRR